MEMHNLTKIRIYLSWQASKEDSVLESYRMLIMSSHSSKWLALLATPFCVSTNAKCISSIIDCSSKSMRVITTGQKVSSMEVQIHSYQIFSMSRSIMIDNLLPEEDDFLLPQLIIHSPIVGYLINLLFMSIF